MNEMNISGGTLVLKECEFWCAAPLLPIGHITVRPTLSIVCGSYGCRV
jgi:hypothetical protein